MGIFDIIGPVMVGPSSSHTAGAVRLGNIARLVLGSAPRRAEFGLHGSFAATGTGHGTRLALLAGVLGLKPDDERIPIAEKLAEEFGLAYEFRPLDLGDVHPNSARIIMSAAPDQVLGVTEVCGSSVGGGEVRVWRIDGFAVELDGLYPTLLLAYPDHPGVVAKVSGALAAEALNIAEMKVHRTARGGEALMVLSLDQEPPARLIGQLEGIPGIERVRFVPRLD